MDEANADLRGVATLGDPVRRALYQFVVRRGGDVGRDEAAIAVGVGRALAAYHLDKLVDEGLLDARFARPAGRGGPGAGRPAKRYSRSGRQVQLSLPPRDYELAARLLARAVEHSDRAALTRTARAFGAELAAEALARCEGRRASARLLECLEEVIGERGYEPWRDGTTIRLRNCPFDALAAEHRDLVCNMNLEIMRGLCDAAGLDRVRPLLDPRPGACCVAFSLTG